MEGIIVSISVCCFLFGLIGQGVTHMHLLYHNHDKDHESYYSCLFLRKMIYFDI